MVKTNTNISLDSDIKYEAKIYLDKRGQTLSLFVEQALKRFIEEESEKEVEQ